MREKDKRETTSAQEALRLLDRLRRHVLEHVPDQEVARGFLKALAEQETLVSVLDAEESSKVSVAQVALIRQAIRFAGFVAGVISYLPRPSHAPGVYEAAWYHVHTMIHDGLDDRAEDQVDSALLAILEVARGEISEAYRLVPRHPGQDLPDECCIFFDALDLGTALLANYLGSPFAVARKEESVHPATRSKYSGGTERYPIDIRTCVINDVRRYLPGQSIAVPDRVFQAVQATYHESIDQLCPEEAGLFTGLLLAVPPLVFALREADFSPEAFIDDKVSFSPHDHPTWGYAWTVSLSRMFFNDDGSPTEVTNRTLASKEFGVFELLDGILESMSRPWGHSNQSLFLGKCRDASHAFAAGDMTGEEIISRIRNRSRIARGIDPSFAWQQFGIYLDDCGTVKTIAFSPWSVSRFSDWSSESQEHRLVRANVEQSAGSLSREVLDRLEWLIAQDLPESAFQRFLEEHPTVLLALGPYRKAVPHIILHQDDGQKLIPDFFLEVADGRAADVLELKLPGARIDLRQARREGLRAEVHKTINQLQTYRDWFQSARHRERFLSETGIRCFRPRALLVFGRSMDFQSHVDRQRLEATLPEWTRLFTYDDLLASAKQWMRRAR